VLIKYCTLCETVQ